MNLSDNNTTSHDTYTVKIKKPGEMVVISVADSDCH